MINLKKGQTINLSKEVGLNIVQLGLGWLPVEKTKPTDPEFDPDVSVFVLDGNGRTLADEWFIFYYNKRSPDDAVVHAGDNLVGSKEGDAETVLINLAKLPAAAQEVSIVVTINDAEKRRQNFGLMKQAYIKVLNAEKPDVAPLARYDLGDEFSDVTSVQVGSLERKDGQWVFSAVGTGARKDLAAYCSAYGLQATA